MKKIKLSINSPKEGLLRQTPNNDGVWGDYKFIINEEVNECDFWVIYSKGQKQVDTCKVGPENFIFLSGEPEPIYHYSQSFINKFAKVITSRRDIQHSNITHLHPSQPWWVGRKMKENGDIEFGLNFNDFNNIKPIKKTKLISVISSNKGFTKGHKDRIKFVQQLKDHFGDSLDVFGKGINGFEDKWDTLKDYKYHIVIENSSYPDYWTEKLADSFLSESFPFYHGCKNLEKYFSENSYEIIDIYDINKSIEIIKSGIHNKIYENRFDDILDAKQKVLNEHNIFPMLTQICDNMDISKPKKEITIKHEMSYFDFYKIPMLIKRFYYKFLTK